MKRSEMLKHIQDALQDHEDFWPWDLAIIVLDKIEKVGMPPPFHYDTYMKVWRDGGSGNVWEPEDEI